MSSQNYKVRGGQLQICISCLHECNRCVSRFRAMLGNPPVPPYGMDPNEEAAEVENYEVGISLY